MLAKLDLEQGTFSESKFRVLRKNPHVDEIENHGMEDGRFFVHLKEGLNWGGCYDDCSTRSFDNITEAKYALKSVEN